MAQQNSSNGKMEVAEEQVSAGTEGLRQKIEEDLEGLIVGTRETGLEPGFSGQDSFESGSALRRSGPSDEIRRSSSSIGGLRSYHRKTAERMLTDYITDMKTLNPSIDDKLQMRIDEYKALLHSLQELYNREPESTLTSEEKAKLVSMLFDYQAAVTPETFVDDPKIDDPEITLVASGVPVYLMEKDFLEGGQYMKSLTAALKLCETQVQKFVDLLDRVKIYTCLCNFLVKALSPAAENSFERYRKVLGNLQNDIAGTSVSDNLRNSVNFCFESLVGLARQFEVVIDLLTKCGSDDWHKSALELANVQPSLLSMRGWSEFPLTIRNCEWSMDLVELAFHALEKLLADSGRYNVRDASFKWSEHKCRMVLQIPGKQLDRNNSAPEKSLLDVSRELELKDVTALAQKLAALAEAEDENQKKIWNLFFPGRKSVYAHGIASFLSQKLAGPSPSTTGKFLPYSFKVINPESLKYVEYLDKGMSGMVAKHTWYGMQVAVKSVRNPILSRRKFEEEAAVLGLVQHPNVVRLIGCAFTEKNSTGMLVMELMDHDLRTIIDSRLHVLPKGSSPFSPIVAIDIMLQIAQAMRYLREHKILHRDLKAKNLLVNICKPLKTCDVDESDCANTKLMGHVPAVSTVLPHTQENYVVKLADFGLAKCLPQSSYVTTHMAGTTGWRAPEVFHVVDTEVSTEYKWPADVYSFAMTCYEILTGEMPFINVPNHSVHSRIMGGERPPLDVVRLEVPEALKELIRECWATDPLSRPSFDQIERRLWECKVKAILPGFERHIMTS